MLSNLPETRDKPNCELKETQALLLDSQCVKHTGAEHEVPALKMQKRLPRVNESKETWVSKHCYHTRDDGGDDGDDSDDDDDDDDGNDGDEGGDGNDGDDNGGDEHY